MREVIDTDAILSVLLADGWHGVVDGSFFINEYDYVKTNDESIHIAGFLGFEFEEENSDDRDPLEPALRVFGRLDSILAIRSVQ